MARELREVAHDAGELAAAITTDLNFELPPEFPKEQLLNIIQSLSELPEGTTEGCWPALEYARDRLPSIRREYVLSAEQSTAEQDPDASPQVLRNSWIDLRLRHLIASTTTALDEYRRLSAELPSPEPLPEAGVILPNGVTEPAEAMSRKLEATLTAASQTMEELSNPNSFHADNMKRQLHDGRGLNRLARTELRMPRVFSVRPGSMRVVRVG